MKRVIVKVHSEHLPEAMELELPGERLLKDLFPHLVQALGLPTQDEKKSAIAYWLEVNGLPMPETKTPTEWGIGNGDTLVIHRSEPLPMNDAATAIGHSPNSDRDQDSLSPADYRFEFDPDALQPNT